MDAARAQQVAEEEFGLTVARLTELGGNEDLNFLAVTPEGARYVVKASATPRSALEAQSAALEFLAEAVATFDVPSPRLTIDGEAVVEIEGTHPFVRVISYVPGEMSVGSRRIVPGVGTALGSVSGEMVAKLASFSHPGLVEGGDWDLREAPRVVAGDPSLGSLLAASLERTARLALPVQVIHGDLTEDNVVLGEDQDFAGVIDFGDLAPSWAVAELAVTLTSLLAHDGPVMAEVLDAVAAFHARRPLALDEARAIWPLVVRRALVLEAGAARVLAADPENTYAIARRPFERLVLSRALALPYDEAELLMLDHDDLLALFQKQPDAALNMLAAMGGMLRKVDRLLQTRVARNVNEEMEERLPTLQRSAQPEGDGLQPARQVVLLARIPRHVEEPIGRRLAVGRHQLPGPFLDVLRTGLPRRTPLHLPSRGHGPEAGEVARRGRCGRRCCGRRCR